MSSSGSTTPNSEGFSGFMETSLRNREAPSPIKKLKNILNKITERTFDKLSDEMLLIDLLDNPEEIEEKEIDMDIMSPFIESFVASICVKERNIEALKVYTRLFGKLKLKWKGRQGSILMKCMLFEISSFFKSYKEMIKDMNFEDEKSNEDRNKCIKLCHFVGNLYKDDLVKIQLVLVILNFFKKYLEENKTVFDSKYLEILEAFSVLFSSCQEKLLEEEIFVDKFLVNYKNFIQFHYENKEIPSMYRFACLELLEKF
jgi:hypothetical protein